VLRLCAGLLEEDGDDDNESEDVEVVHADIDGDSVRVTLIVIIPVADVLAHADNREETETDGESNGLLDDDVDCE